MAKLVTKFKYLPPENRTGIGGYANYIATREGVEKIDNSKQFAPATASQKKFIGKLLRDFPECRTMLEYEDYIAKPNVGNASEFITRAVEDHADSMMTSKTYADYIATRPRAERIGSHGLFTDDGVKIDLAQVSEDLNRYTGNVWTVIISLRREDAQRLGYNTGARWRDMLRGQTQELSDRFHIPMGELKWFAAFHNESHHPHVHLIVYSHDPKQGRLSKDGIAKLRSSFGRQIFAQDLISVYEKQTRQRDDLRQSSRERIAQIAAEINRGCYDDPAVEEKLRQLALRLSRTSGKKQYGYLKADVKALVDSIVDDMAREPRIAALYDLWYQSREEILRTYTDEMPARLPLSQNKEFKAVRNAVVQAAMDIVLNRESEDGPELPQDADDAAEEPEAPEEAPRDTDEAPNAPNKWELYRQAMALLEKDSPAYDPDRAVELLIRSARLGCGVAKYRLGKMFLRGDDVPKDVDYALRWLEEAAAENDPYAQYLLGKTLLRGTDVEQDIPAAVELLRRAIAQGSPYAAYTLGKALLDGTVPGQDIPEAIRLLTFSADNGFPVAQYVLGKTLYAGEVIPRDTGKALDYLERAAAGGDPYAAYLAGKIRMTEEAFRDIPGAIRWLELAAQAGNTFAEYRLDRIYLYGIGVEKDMDRAMAWLRSAAEHGNQYSEQLLHSVSSRKNQALSMAVLRLLHHISRILRNQLDDRDRKGGGVDRKLRRAIDEKKQAHGLKQG